MTDKEKASSKGITLDWLLRGVLTKLGDTLDRFTGRRWQPSSSLATSELIERLKVLVDAEVKDLGPRGKFVPHNIKLKMQWDKFSTDSEDALKKLENELTVALIDHLNDNRYHTYSPVRLEVKPDYFTEGVKLLASYDEFDEIEREAAINVTVPQIKVGEYVPEPAPAEAEKAPEPPAVAVRAQFMLGGLARTVVLTFEKQQRKSVGRSKENDLWLDDPSVSKSHASLAFNPAGRFVVADTGSTNGTFIKDSRIAYGKAFEIAWGDTVKIGEVSVNFELAAPQPVPADDMTDSKDAGDALAEPAELMKTEASIANDSQPAPTEQGILIEFPDDDRADNR